MNCQRVWAVLAELKSRRGVPKYTRSDHSPEFTISTVLECIARIGVNALFVELGTPEENGENDSIKGRLLFSRKHPLDMPVGQ